VLDHRREVVVGGLAEVARGDRDARRARPGPRAMGDDRHRRRRARPRANRDIGVALEAVAAIGEPLARPALDVRRRRRDTFAREIVFDHEEHVGAAREARVGIVGARARSDRAERGRRGDHLAERDAERVLVRARVDGLAALLLRRHVPARSGALERGRLIEPARDPEVDELGDARERHHDVARVDVAMHHARGVRVGEAAQHVARDRERDRDGHRAGCVVDQLA
jgi:hypothetical protein